MFKKDKDMAERSKTLLKNKEIRSLTAEVLKQYPRLNEESLGELLFKKANVSMVKLSSRSILYFIDGTPFFFDKEGRNQIYPTIFFCWRFPDVMRTYVVHSPVSEYILNGADLMLPGLATSQGTIFNPNTSFPDLLLL